MISVTSKGDLAKTIIFINALRAGTFTADLHAYGRMGVEALSRATPVESGLTANSWGYSILKGKRKGIQWFNTNVVDGIPVAILIQYGHATGNGAYIEGRDFINPAIQPIFDKISENVWKQVKA